eukprot:SAG22_NODE_1418_length_4469_cov_1.911670_1_plen_1205_part_10
MYSRLEKGPFEKGARAASRSSAMMMKLLLLTLACAAAAATPSEVANAHPQQATAPALSAAAAAAATVSEGAGIHAQQVMSTAAAPALRLAPHPRLRLSSARLAALRKLVVADKVAAGMLSSIRTAGERLLSAPVLSCNISGPGGLLGTAGGLVNRIYTLAFLHRLDHGNRTWSARATAEMLAVAAFASWNPPHFLDTAEMSHGMAIGYDWMHDAIGEADRRTIESAVLRLGIGEYLQAIAPPHGNEWARGDWNWNQVVNGGMVAASLAFGDADQTAGLVPAAAAALVATSAALKLAFASYAPVGAWPEGAGYWGYGTRYALTASTSLSSATGGDGGLSGYAGFAETGNFCVYHLGPATQTVFNWADSGEEACEAVNLMQLAALFPDRATTFAPTARALIDGVDGLANPDPGSVAAKGCSSWYRGNLGFSCVVSLMTYTAVGSVADLGKLLPLDYVFERRAVGFMRGRWGDRNTSWLGFKGCNSTADHGDLDAGTFVLEMGGQRWAIDLGSGNYALQGYWRKESAVGDRYSYYRKSSRGHNTLTFGGWDGDPIPSNQLVGGPGGTETLISDFNSSNKSATVDMTLAYSHFGVTKVLRHFAWDSAAMTRLSITDDIRAVGRFNTAAKNLTWAMHTRANISLDGRRAVLSQGGMELLVELHEPAEAVFSSSDVQLHAPQRSAVGIRKLLVEQPAVSADQQILVTLSMLVTPGSGGGTTAPLAMKTDDHRHTAVAAILALGGLAPMVAAGGPPRAGPPLGQGGDIITAPLDQSQLAFDAWWANLTRFRTQRRQSTDRRLYDEPALQWAATSFVETQAMLHDRFLFDRVTNEWTPGRFLADLESRYGGIDTVMLWHAYPNLGIDSRNQFELLTDLPGGGLQGLKSLVSAFHAAGVRVLLCYNPWDTGTNPSYFPSKGVTPFTKVIQSVLAVGADGFNGDQMFGVPAGFQEAAKQLGSPPIVLEPEICFNNSATGVATDVMTWSGAFNYAGQPAPATLAFKVIETRHMVHVLDRDTKDRTAALQTSWWNAAGVHTWENVFGIYNQLTPRIAVGTKAVSMLLHGLAGLFQGKDIGWRPHAPVTTKKGLFASEFVNKSMAAWTLVNVDNATDWTGPTILAPCRAVAAVSGVESGSNAEAATPVHAWFDLFAAKKLSGIVCTKQPGTTGWAAAVSVPVERSGLGGLLRVDDATDSKAAAAVASLLARVAPLTLT